MEDNKETEYKYSCEKCEYKCNYISQWNNHINTELHKTGLRKKRSDCKEDIKCEKCDYKTRNLTTMKKHKLNKHLSLEEREKGFKFYCKSCDFGSFSQDTMDVHYNSEKHKIYMIRQIKK